MSIKLLMPALSPTMTEGTIGKWLKQEGDQVEPGDIIAEIETDKATMEFESIDSGILAKILVPDNTQGVKVNSVIAILAEEGENPDQIQLEDSVAPSVEQQPQIQAKHECKNEVQFASSGSECQRIFASPLAKRIAHEENIDLTKVTGTGPYGRIVKNDLLYHNSSATSENTVVHQHPVIDSKQVSQPSPRSNVIEPSIMRKVIAQRLVESKTTIPHFYLTVECNVDKLISLREAINLNYEQIEISKKISVNDMVVRATSLALSDMPSVNVAWIDNKIIQHESVDISVAVSLDEGLITPIVKNADNKSLSVISNEIKSLAKRAREGKLRHEEFQGGSISISNLGMYNIDSFLAIVNPPQSCIISVGGISKKPIVLGDEIIVGSMMSISISCDHRVIDGALAAQFINKIKLYLENPLSLV